MFTQSGPSAPAGDAPGSAEAGAAALAEEQAYLTVLYARLDGVRQQTEEQLRRTLRQTGGTPQARSERETATQLYTRRLGQVAACEVGLCFGRLDLADGQRRHIGRLGLFDESEEYRPLLIDWRAPAARAFYLATGADPQGVVLRRHIRTERRRVTGLQDEVLDLAAPHPDRETLTGEAALLAAITAERTGRMGDIVATIQAEQDHIIRADHRHALVVQGGPGTGKTAVALHRAAYLLYTHREQLASRGVLIVGPSGTFLQYIDQVLPSLGETGVLLATVGDLFPGVRARAVDAAAVTALKGDPGMAAVVAAAVADRQEVPDQPWTVVVDGDEVVVDPQVCQRARERARRSGRLHNQAREVFAQALVEALARQVAERIGADPLGGENLLSAADVADLRAEMAEDPAVLGLVERWWPVLTPQRLLEDLYASPARLAAVGLDEVRQGLLRRERGAAWTVADVPLLDEAAQVLGDVPQVAAQVAAEARMRDRVAYAQGVLNIALGSRSVEFEDEESEVLTAFDLLDAEQLATRHDRVRELTVAERAAADRRWAFGHVIVDEAQELSPMALRMLLRRCPSRSMTLVGDVAQTGDPAGVTAWSRLLGPYLGDRWQVRELTVNYRTPAEVMAVAGDVLAAVDAGMRVPRSVRECGVWPWRHEVDAEVLLEWVVRHVEWQARVVGQGRVAVIVPRGLAGDVRSAVGAAVGVGEGVEPDLLSTVVVVDAAACKGLEFDMVLVVDPAGLVAESGRGLNDLYVAVTRTTRGLGVIHSGPVPAVLGRLRPWVEGMG